MLLKELVIKMYSHNKKHCGNEGAATV